MDENENESKSIVNGTIQLIAATFVLGVVFGIGIEVAKAGEKMVSKKIKKIQKERKYDYKKFSVVK